MRQINLSYFLLLFAIPVTIFGITGNLSYSLVSAGIWAAIGALVEAFESVKK